MNCGRIGHHNTTPMNITEVETIDYLMELLGILIQNTCLFDVVTLLTKTVSERIFDHTQLLSNESFLFC
jgi:hypothetical protein